jgi:tRNA threonylcarbamoyladenosine biosynthesis protein TsaE
LIATPSNEEEQRNVVSATFMLETPDETRAWGRALGRMLQPGDVIALSGDLGAGKTTLTQGIATGMGIRDEVTSPTFTLLHEYRGAVPLFHLDPYRLERSEDLYDLGFEEYLERGGVTVIEWAERLEGQLPPERMTLVIEVVPPGFGVQPTGQETGEIAPRRIVTTASGTRYVQLLQTLVAARDGVRDHPLERRN